MTLIPLPPPAPHTPASLPVPSPLPQVANLSTIVQRVSPPDALHLEYCPALRDPLPCARAQRWRLHLLSEPRKEEIPSAASFPPASCARLPRQWFAVATACALRSTHPTLATQT